MALLSGWYMALLYVGAGCYAMLLLCCYFHEHFACCCFSPSIVFAMILRCLMLKHIAAVIIDIIIDNEPLLLLPLSWYEPDAVDMRWCWYWYWVLLLLLLYRVISYSYYIILLLLIYYVSYWYCWYPLLIPYISFCSEIFHTIAFRLHTCCWSLASLLYWVVITDIIIIVHGYWFLLLLLANAIINISEYTKVIAIITYRHYVHHIITPLHSAICCPILLLYAIIVCWYASCYWSG